MVIMMMSDDDNGDDDADEYVEVNTLKVVRGKRANSLKWDHTGGGGGVEHSVIEAYKWPNFLRPIYKQAKKGNTNKDHGRGVLSNHAIQKEKLEKTIPHHGMDGWMGGGNGSQTQIKHCNRSKHGSFQFGLKKGKKV